MWTGFGKSTFCWANRRKREQGAHRRRRLLCGERLERRDLLAASDPIPLTALDDVLFFVANDGIHGRELWRSDGTTAGTRLLADIAPGSPSSDIRSAKVLNNDLYFVANDGTTGLELWKLDLATEQFGLVRDIKSGVGQGSFPIDLTVFDGELYFSAHDDTHGRELWKTNGTAAGTVLVTDLVPGSGSSDPRHFVEFQGELFFAAEGVIKTGTGRKQKTVSTGKELWKSDGTAAGTVLVKDAAVGTGSSFPASLTEVNGKLFFTAFGATPSGKSTVSQGQELWVTDGTTQGTFLVKDIAAGTASSEPSMLTNLDGTLYFAAREQPGSQVLWKSDGTAAGTQRVLNNIVVNLSSENGPMPVAAGKLFFHSFGPTGDLELYAFAPITNTLTSIRSVLPASALETGVEVTLTIKNFGGTIFFTAFEPASGLELWKVDPDTLQPTLVRDIFPAKGVDDPEPLHFFGLANGRFFFSADDGEHGRELWFSDGTTEGTVLVADLA